MTAANDHLDLDLLAELDEGLGDIGARQSHVDGCKECRRRLDQVRRARAQLSGLPAETMPADVAARVHAALQREPPTATIVPAGRRRRWGQHPTLAGLGAAAAGVALIAAVVVGATRSSGHGGSSDSNAGAALAPGTRIGNFPILSTGSRYTDANAASLAAQLDAIAHSGATGAPAAPAPSAGRSATKATAGTDALLLAGHSPVPAELQPLYNDRQQLLTCARLLAGTTFPVTPLAVDFGRFTGGLRHVRNAPAVVILLPRQSGVHDGAFIVGPNCTTDPSQDLYAFEAVLS